MASSLSLRVPRSQLTAAWRGSSNRSRWTLVVSHQHHRGLINVVLYGQDAEDAPIQELPSELPPAGYRATGGMPGFVIIFTGMIFNQAGEKDSEFILFFSPLFFFSQACNEGDKERYPW